MPSKSRSGRPHCRSLKRLVRRDTVLVCCLHAGCPRKRRIPRPDDMGKNVAAIECHCPWHEDDLNGCKEAPEYFYDAKGRQLDFVTWKPM